MTVLSQIMTHTANRQSRYRSLISAIFWQCYKRVTGKPLDVEYHGYKLRCHPDNHSTSRAIYFSSLPDYWEMRFIQDYLRPGDKFIDCGANAGLYTLLAASKIGTSGHIDAFEPNPKVAKKLRDLVRLNNLQNVDIHQIGLADIVGQLDLMMTGDDSTSYIASELDKAGEYNEIEVTRLDSYLQEDTYAMAKFDIEGYEPFAVRGASNWLARNNPSVMLLEVSGLSKRHGISSSQFVDGLESYGYFTAIYCPETQSLIKTKRHWEDAAENVLAIACQAEDFVAQRIDFVG